MFSIPGWDTTIGYNSFNRYKFEYWDIGKIVIKLTSKYSYPKYTNITITYDRGQKIIYLCIKTEKKSVIK